MWDQDLVYQDIVVIDKMTVNILSFPWQGLPAPVSNKCTCNIQDPLKSTPVPQKVSARLFLKHCAVWLNYMTRLLGKDKFKWSKKKKLCEKEVCLEMSGRGKGSEEKWVAPLLFCIFFPCVYSKVPFLMVLVPLEFPCPVRRIVPFNFHCSNVVNLFMQIRR